MRSLKKQTQYCQAKSLQSAHFIYARRNLTKHWILSLRQPTQQCSKYGKIYSLQTKLLGHFLHQELVGCEVLPIPAELQRMGTVVRWNIVERILGVMSKKTMKAIFSEKSHHFQMVVFQALKDLGEKKREHVMTQKLIYIHLTRLEIRKDCA